MNKLSIFVIWSVACGSYLLGSFAIVSNLNRPDLFPNSWLLLLPFFGFILLFLKSRKTRQRAALHLKLRTKIEKAHPLAKRLRQAAILLTWFVALPLISISVHHAVLGTAFTISTFGNAGQAERLFKVICHSDEFIGNESIALFQIASARKVNETFLRQVLISTYGDSSSQLAEFDFEFGGDHILSKDWKGAERLLAESVRISSAESSFNAQQIKLKAASKLAIAEANLKNSAQARTLMSSTLLSVAHYDDTTKLEVLRDLLTASVAIDYSPLIDDSVMANQIWTAKTTLEAASKQDSGSEPCYGSCEIIAIEGALLLLTYAASVLSESCLMRILKSKELISLKRAHSSLQHIAYSHLIDLDLYLGQVEQANTHSICLLRNANLLTKRKSPNQQS